MSKTKWWVYIIHTCNYVNEPDKWILYSMGSTYAVSGAKAKANFCFREGISLQVLENNSRQRFEAIATPYECKDFSQIIDALEGGMAV